MAELKNKNDLDAAPKAADTELKKVGAERSKPKNPLPGGNDKGFRLGDIETIASRQIKAEKARSPFDPKKPMDSSVLEKAGFGGGATPHPLSGKKKIGAGDENSALASAVGAVHKAEEAVAKDMSSAVSSGISVNPDYKPGTQSGAAARLASKMETPDKDVFRSGGNVAESASPSTGAAGTAQQPSPLGGGQLGGGFRVTSDPTAPASQPAVGGEPASVPGANQASGAGQMAGNAGNMNAGAGTGYPHNANTANPGMAAASMMGGPGANNIPDNNYPAGMQAGSPNGPARQMPGAGGAGNGGGDDGGGQSTYLQRYEEETGKRSGVMAGVVGMLGGALLAGGIATVALKPELVQNVTGTLFPGGDQGRVSAADEGVPVDKIAERRRARSAIIPPAEDSGSRMAAAPAPESGNARMAAMTPPARQTFEAAPSPAQVDPASNAGVSLPAARPDPDESVAEGNAILAVLDVKGDDNQPIPLSIAVLNVGPSKEAYVRLSGMPDNVKLSDGIHLGPSGWLLPLDKLTTLRLTAPEGFSGTLKLKAQLLEADAETPVGKSKSFKVAIGSPGEGSGPSAVVSSVRNNAGRGGVTRLASNSAPARRPVRVRRPALPGLSAAREGADEFGGFLPSGGNRTGQQQQRQRQPQPQLSYNVPARAPRRLQDHLPVNPGDRRAVRVESLEKRGFGSGGRRQPAQTASVEVPRLTTGQKRRLLRRGDQLYRLGDLASARLMYQQVAVTGDPQAALALGRTYDPIYFDKLGVQGFDPEPETAISWYRKAEAAGLEFKAREKIAKLKAYINR